MGAAEKLCGTTPIAGRPPGKQLAGKYLTFHLAEETYGLAILKVQEIIGMIPVTHVPRMPSFMRGVVNLRGKIIPVIDLRVEFALTTQQDTTKTCIIFWSRSSDPAAN